MSISPIVDEHYRLRPTDVGRGSIQVTVQNVSWQGVEQLQPLLHLREFPQKRLLLNQQQVQSITEIVGSTLARDWIGHRLVLAVQYQLGEPVITLHSAAPTNLEPTDWRPALHLSERARTLLLLLLLALLFVLVFLLDNANTQGQSLSSSGYAHTGHLMTGFSTASANLSTLLHQRIITKACTVVGAALANLSTDATGTRVKSRMAQHKISASLANLATV